MKRFFIILFSLILSCFPCKVLADELPYIQYLPEYMPQAPMAQSIARAIDIPVNLYTGIPNITIPLYTIQVGDISVPITLSYQGGGIRPSQEATCVGLGWMLNAGGAITRTVKCADDFMEYQISGSQFEYGFLDKPEWPDLSVVDENYYTSFRRITHDGYYYWDHYLHTDSEADIFFYSLPTQSGKFSFKKDKSIVYFDKSKNVKITPSFGVSPRPYFYAVDAQGTGYCFEEKERTYVYSGRGLKNVNTTSGGVDVIYDSGAFGVDYFNLVADYTSTWYLTRMISATNDTVDFEYEDESFHLPLQESCRYQKKTSGAYGFDSGEGDGPKYSISKTNVESKRLIKIKWRGGSVEFKYGTARSDLYRPTDMSGDPKPLTSVTVRDMNGQAVCYWTMSYGYFNDDIEGVANNNLHLFKRLRLDEVRNVLTEEAPYKFTYNDLVSLPVKNTKNLDYWGYYNGINQGNTYYCPASSTIVESSPKSVNEEKCKIGILKSIKHPTGGTTQLHWESNTINNGYKRGGLRIARIEGERDISYVYEGGKDLIYPCIYYYEELRGYDWAATCMIQPSESVRPLSTINNGNTIGYSKVWEIFEDNSKTEYAYYNEEEAQPYLGLPYFPTLTEWKNGLLLERICYDKFGDTISTLTNTYDSKITTERYIMGFGEVYTLELRYYYNSVEFPFLTQSVHTEYRENGKISTRKKYLYNVNLLCSEETTLTGSESHKVIYKYANDYSDDVSRKMQLCNQIGFPVAQWTMRNGVIHKGHRSIYANFSKLSADGNSIICGNLTGNSTNFSETYLPRYLLTLNTSNSATDISNCIYDTTIVYDSYTRYGRARDLNYLGMPIVYVWGYKGMYPIAEIKNTTYEDFIDRFGYFDFDRITEFDTNLDEMGNMRHHIKTTCDLLGETSVNINFYKPLVGAMDMTDNRGVVHSYGYDAAGRLSSAEITCVSNPGLTELTNSYMYGTNHVSSKNYLTGQSSSSIENVQYYDEWGRPSVSAAQGVKSDGTYSYSMQTYDSMGRPHRSYLSVPSSNTTGELLDATTVQNLSLAAFANDPFGYTQTSYDALGRAVETTMPGRAWNENGKSTTIQYLTNTANDVKRYTVSGNALVESGYYEVGTLDCTVTTDPDGLTIKSYKDLFGNVVLERRAENFDTYYVYDNLNHLRFVLPPKYQVEKNLGYYAYQYEYDGRGRMVKKTLPGCEPIQYWYDNADRLVRMQDGVLAQSDYSRVWSYDGLGRQFSQGIERNGTLLHYEMLNFYDDYDFVEDYTSYLPTTVSGLLPPQYYYDKHGYLTGTWQRTSDGQGMLSVMGYDDYGNLSKKTVSALGKFLVVSDYEHNLAGDVVNEQFKEYRYLSSNSNWGKALAGTVENNYSYPHTHLLTSSVLSLLDDGGNTLRTDTINHFTYDDFGRILRNNRGGTKADMTYEYTPMHSWLNRIRSGCGFDQRLYRETEGNNPRWTGGVSAMTWKVNNAYLRRFDYDYDSMNRLTSAEYSQYQITGGSSLSPTLSLLPVGMENEDYTSEYGYDKNSNLLWAYRQGVVDDVEAGLYYDTMDDYNASYRGNQKLSVGGTGAGEPSYYGSLSFVDGADEAVEYAYNANGSMTMDLNKGITNIAYDLLGNLKEITFDNNRIIRYVYAADGTRLRTVHLQKKNGVWLKDSTDYYGNLLLKNGALDKYLFSDGYLSFSNGTVNGCHYYIKDYQGSNRMVVNNGGTTEQTTHYYPYGGVIGGIDTGASSQPYKFEGKELDRTYGLDWYDIHARQYDPIVPAWHTIDPQAEKSYHISPYAYCAGDPVNKVDRNGELPDVLWDVANVLYDIGAAVYHHIVGEHDAAKNYWEDAAFDGASMFIPGLPAGVSKATKVVSNSAPKTIRKIPPNRGKGRPHGGEIHNKAIDDYIENIRKDNTVEEIRKNQRQVDVDGNSVGRNRPDVQYNKGDIHYNVEFDTKESSSEFHKKIIEQNDPKSKNEFIILK